MAPVVRRVLLLLALITTGAEPWLRAQAQIPATDVAFPQLSEQDAREWLTYLASDALQGREVFTEGYGLAAAYVAEHLGAWGLTPLGSGGTFLQQVAQHGYRVARRSS